MQTLPPHSPPKKVGRLLITGTSTHKKAESSNTKLDGKTRQPEPTPKPRKVKTVSGRPKSRSTITPMEDIEEEALKLMTSKTNDSEYEEMEDGRLEIESKRKAEKIPQV